MKLKDLLDGSAAWHHEDPEVRLQALGRKNVPQDTLTELLERETDNRVRAAAVARLESVALLQQLLTSQQCDQESPAIISRLAELQDESSFTHWISKDATADQLMNLVRFANSADIKLQAVELLTEEAQFQQLLALPVPTKVHQHCAHQLNSRTAIEQCLKNYLHKDKAVVHICREKLDALDQAAAAEAQYLKDAELMLTSLSHLAESEFDEHYEARFQHLQEEWQSHLGNEVHSLPAELQAQWQAQVEICQNLLTEIPKRRTETIATADKLITEASARKDALSQAGEPAEDISSWLSESEATWDHLDKQHLSEAQVSAWHAAIEPLANFATIWNNWLKVQEQLPGTEDAAKLTRLLESVHFPAEMTPPQAFQDAQQRLTQLQDEQVRYARRQENITRDLTEKLKTFGAELEKGDLKAAGRLNKSIGKSLAKLDKKGALESEYHQFQAKLKELRDWQGFATAPKREALCEKMEALIEDTSISPGDRATAIKELQNDWKELGPSDTHIEQQLWSRFREAGDKAYAPCKEHFAAMHQARLDHLKIREAVCEQLEAILNDTDWSSPDWKAVTRAIQQQRNTWRDHSDVPRGQYRKVSNRFHKVMEALDKHLSNEQDRNRLQKQALIDQLNAALESDEAAPVDLAKQLQQQWKQIGIVERKADQKLWKQFRRACDQAFDRLKNQQNAVKDARKAKDQEADQLIDQLGKVADALGDAHLAEEDFRSLVADYNRIKGEYSELSVPDKHRSRQRLRNLDKLLSKARQQRATIRANQEINQLKQAAELCRQLESGAETREALTAKWDELEFVDDKIGKAIAARWQEAESDGANEDTLAEARDLVIQTEILASLDSPAEYQNRRMEIQVERLNRQLAQGEKDNRSRQEQLKQLQISWYCLGRLPADEYETLTSRFERAASQVS